MKIFDNAKIKKLILGPPGTGKTTRLLSIIEQKLEDGMDPMRIGYYSFTRNAAREAQNRAIERFGFKRKQLEYFRTLHSQSWRSLKSVGFQPHLLTDAQLKELGENWNAKFYRTAFLSSERDIDDFDPAPKGLGDIYLHHYRLCRALGLTPEKFRDKMGDEYLQRERLISQDLNWKGFKEFYAAMREHGDNATYLDYPDLIELASKHCPPLPLKIGIIDEAQDLSRQQWILADTLLAGCDEIYIAGDDDQAIYEWSGADLETFRRLQSESGFEPIVLSQSYRLPKSVFDMSQVVVNRIEDRYPKEWTPKAEEGFAAPVLGIRGIPFGNGERWLILARNEKFLQDVSYYLNNLGLVYTRDEKRSVDPRHWKAIVAWTRLTKGSYATPDEVKAIYKYLLPSALKDARVQEEVETAEFDTEYVDFDYLKKHYGLRLKRSNDWFSVFDFTLRKIEYYRAVLKRSGSDPIKDPKIRIATIHTVKGEEEDNVVVLRSMSNATWDSYQRKPDSEHRVFYVAMTRAKKSLYLVRLKTNDHYYKPLVS